MELTLSTREAAMLSGTDGIAVQMAMNVVVGLARAEGADRLVEISSAHVGSDLVGESSVDLMRTFFTLGAQFAVPTTLNIASFDLLHPELFHGSEGDGRAAREVMQLTARLGGEKTWTCAPYLLSSRPAFGEHVAWSESGAVVFANSVLGARTDRGGIFADLCSALTARTPASGLHLDSNRRAGVRIDLGMIPQGLFEDDLTFHLLGYWIGEVVGSDIPLLEGLPSDLPEQRLHVLGNALATSGAAGMFHALGITPEASSAEEAFGGRTPRDVLTPLVGDLATVRTRLSSARSDSIDAVCLGTPQYSMPQFEELIGLLEAYGGTAAVSVYVNTNRRVLGELQAAGWSSLLQGWGITLVTDTCTYMAPMLNPNVRVVMTNSAKWAHYGRPERGVDVVLASTSECIRSALTGRVCRDDDPAE